MITGAKNTSKTYKLSEKTCPTERNLTKKVTGRKYQQDVSPNRQNRMNQKFTVLILANKLKIEEKFQE